MIQKCIINVHHRRKLRLEAVHTNKFCFVTKNTLVGFFAVVVLISRKTKLISHNSREIIEVFYFTGL